MQRFPKKLVRYSLVIGGSIFAFLFSVFSSKTSELLVHGDVSNFSVGPDTAHADFPDGSNTDAGSSDGGSGGCGC